MRIPALAMLALLNAAALAAQDGVAAPRDTLLAADLAWSDRVAGGAPDAFVGLLTDDAVYLHPGAPLMRGPVAIGAFLAAQPSARVRWQPLRAELSRDSDVGVTFGVTARDREADAPALGRYITFWRRTDGRWRAEAVMVTDAAPVVLPPAWSAAVEPSRAASGPRAEMERADRAFSEDAAARGAGPAFMAAAAPTATMFGGAGALRLGPDEIGASLAGPARWRWRPVASGAARGGDLGYTVGEAEIVSTGTEGAQTYFSKYLTIWQRQGDGSWKFLTDGGNRRPAP